MKYFFILNPGSKGGKNSQIFNTIFKLLDKEGIKYDYRITKSLDDAYFLSLEANKSKYETIVVCGGDGTINRVLSGFYDENGKRISVSKMGVIYTGTSPDFCKSYNIPIKLESAVSVLLQNNIRQIQVGRIRYVDEINLALFDKPLTESNKITTRYFACCANFGLGPLLAEKANSGIRKRIGDFLGTFSSLIYILFSYRPDDFIIKKDDCLEKINNIFNISIGKTYYVASGIKINNELKEGDSRFYCLIIRNLQIKNWIKVLRMIYSGKQIVDNEVISLNYCRSLEIYGNNTHPEIEFDGDRIGFLPCQIEMAEDKLDLICDI